MERYVIMVDCENKETLNFVISRVEKVLDEHRGDDVDFTTFKPC